MSHYPFDRSFHPGMSRTLLRLATDFRMDNRIVPWDELTGSDTDFKSENFIRTTTEHTYLWIADNEDEDDDERVGAMGWCC